jgi:hypothetical protein
MLDTRPAVRAPLQYYQQWRQIMAKLNFPKPKTPSHIQNNTYDPTTETLTVHFKSGRSYKYSGVPHLTADRFRNADSMTKFLRANIIGKHEHKEIMPPVRK